MPEIDPVTAEQTNAALAQAVALLNAGDAAAAEEVARGLIAALPGEPAVWRLLGLISRRAGRLDAAQTVLQWALCIAPDDGATWHELAVDRLHAAGNRPETRTALRRACRLQGPAATGWSLLAGLFGQAKMTVEARAPLRAALCLDPADAGAWLNRAEIAKATNDGAGAAAVARCLRLTPGFAAAWNALGDLARAQGAILRAIDCFRAAIALAPQVGGYYHNLALMETADHRFVAAVATFARAQTVDPTYVHGFWDAHVPQFLLGNVSEGWKFYEWRWRWPELDTFHRLKEFPLWRGEDASTARVLIWGEQGIGEELMLCSLVPEAAARIGQCVLEVDPRLQTLFQRSFPGIEVVGHAVPRPAATLGPGIAYHVPIGNLGPILRPTRDSFRLHHGILKPDPARAAAFEAWLGGHGRAPRIGLLWSSSLLTRDRAIQYASFEQMARQLPLQGCILVNLLAGAAAPDTGHGLAVLTPPGLDQRNDIDGVAAMLSRLDLVIAPGSTVANIASGLGIETWMFRGYPERWGLGGRQCVWYAANNRLYEKFWRESWDDFLAGIGRDLADFITRWRQLDSRRNP